MTGNHFRNQLASVKKVQQLLDYLHRRLNCLTAQLKVSHSFGGMRHTLSHKEAYVGSISRDIRRENLPAKRNEPNFVIKLTNEFNLIVIVFVC